MVTLPHAARREPARRPASWWLVLAMAAGCSAKTQDAREAWLEARGMVNGDACVRIAAAMRAECQGNRDCEQQVSVQFSYSCYVGSYASQKPDAPVWMASPCLWNDINRIAQTGGLRQPGESGYIPPEIFAEMRCREAGVQGALSKHCHAEIMEFIFHQCAAGDARLTGAGP